MSSPVRSAALSPSDFSRVLILILREVRLACGRNPQKLSKFWQASVGSGHAALGVPGAIPTTIPIPPGSSLGHMWQEQLKAVHDDTGIYGVRFHGSFDDDMGPVAVASASGEIAYKFTSSTCCTMASWQQALHRSSN